MNDPSSPDTNSIESGCPPTEQLVRFLESVSEPGVAEHIDGCSACQAALDQLAQPSSRVLHAAHLAGAPLEGESEPAPRHPDYELLSEQPVARGAMGVLWPVRDRRHGRRLAMKVLSMRWATQPEMRARFREETVLACQLQHTGLVPIYDDGFLPPPDERPYYVMRFIRGAKHERLPGDTLESRLPSGPCPAEQLVTLLEVVRDVARTLGYLHEHGVVHRDVKPHNIMLGPHQEAFLLDLGLAKKLLATSEPAAAETDVGTVVTTRTNNLISTHSSHGTPGYMPPEQARNDSRAITQRSDVFSLGVILVRILTGEMVFEGRDSATVRGNTLAGNTAEAAARIRACGADPALVSLALRCIEVEPARRPADGNAVAEELTGFLDSLETKRRDAQVKRAVARTLAVASLLITAISLAAATWLWAMNQRLGKVNADLGEATRRAEANAQEAKQNAERADRNAARASTNERLAEARREEAQRQAQQAREARVESELALGQTRLQSVAPGRGAAGTSDGTQFAETRRAFLSARAGLDQLGTDPYAADLGLTRLMQLAPPPASSLELPEAAILHVSLSPDQRWALVSFAGGGLDLCDLHTGERISLARRHSDVIWTHAFSPDGKLFATGGGDGRIVIWDSQQRAPRFHSDAHLRDVTALAFTGDGTRIVSVDGSLGRRSGPLLQSASPKLGAGNGYMALLNLSSEQPGDIGSTNPARLVVTDVADGKSTTVTQRPARSAISLAVSPDDQLAVCGCDDGFVEIYGLDQGQSRLERELQVGGIQDVRFFSDSQALLVGNTGRMAVVDTSRGEHELLADDLASEGSGAIMRSVLGSDGRYVLVSRRDGTARLYDAVLARHTATLVGHGDGTRLGPLAVGRSWAVVGAEGRLWRYVLNSPFADIPLVGADEDTLSWSLCRDRPWIVGASHDGRIRIWDDRSGEVLLSLYTGSPRNGLAAISSDGKFLAAASASNRVRIWRLTDAARPVVSDVREIATPLQGIRVLAIDPRGQYAAAGDDQGTVALLSLAEARVCQTLPAESSVQKKPGVSIGVLPDLQSVASDHRPSPVSELAFSPDGRRLAVKRSTVSIWQVAEGGAEHERNLEAEPAEPGSGLAFSPDGSLLVSMRRTDSAKLQYLVWDLASGRPQRTLDAAAASNESPLVWNLVGGGDQLLTVRSNGKLIVRDATGGKELIQLSLDPAPLRIARADRSGRRLLLQTLAGSAYILHVDSHRWSEGLDAEQVEALLRQLVEGPPIPGDGRNEPSATAFTLPGDISEQAAAEASGATHAFRVYGGDCRIVGDGRVFWISGEENPVFELAVGEQVVGRRLMGLRGGPLAGWPERGRFVGRSDPATGLILQWRGLKPEAAGVFELAARSPLRVWSVGQASERLVAGFQEGALACWNVASDHAQARGRITLPSDVIREVEARSPDKVEWFRTLQTAGQPLFFPVESLAVSPDGRYAVSGHATLARGEMAGVVAVHDLEEQETRGWTVLAGGSVTAVGGYGDGQPLAAGQWNGTLHTLRLGDQGLVTEASWPAHEGMIRTALVSADGSRLYSAGTDQTVKIWNPAEPGKPLRVLSHPAGVLDMALSRDERRLITVCADGFVRVFDLPR